MAKRVEFALEVVRTLTQRDDEAVLAMAGDGSAQRVRVGIDLAPGHITDIVQWSADGAVIVDAVDGGAPHRSYADGRQGLRNSIAGDLARGLARDQAELTQVGILP
jgi:hypothetical protein